MKQRSAIVGFVVLQLEIPSGCAVCPSGRLGHPERSEEISSAVLTGSPLDVFSSAQRLGVFFSLQVMRDPETGVSRGFGFISYDTFEASDAALAAMNGQFICNRPIHVSYAYKKDTRGGRKVLLRAAPVLGVGNGGLPRDVFADDVQCVAGVSWSAYTLIYKLLSRVFVIIFLFTCRSAQWQRTWVCICEGVVRLSCPPSQDPLPASCPSAAVSLFQVFSSAASRERIALW